jgi:FAD/FMN-containing dehydrogenase
MRWTRTGLDLLPLVVGSEGMLAITLEVTVKLTPKPQLARCIMASFDDLRKAGDAVAAVIAAGIIPAGLEMMDKPMTAAVEDFVHAGYDLNAEAILLCESDGTPEEVEEEIGRMSAVLQGCGATAIAVSKDEAERLKILERAQKRVSCEWSYQPRLHVHGLDDSAQTFGRHLVGNCRDGKKIRAALRECVSCRRRQFASVDFV